MPLLISSRMTSAGLTLRVSASSLTVIVAGSSMAARSWASATCTGACANAASRRTGLRGPRRPRVPLLLLATGSSLGDRGGGRGRGEQRDVDVLWNGGLQRPRQPATGQRQVEAATVPADVGSPARHSAALVNDQGSVRRPHDAQQ